LHNQHEHPEIVEETLSRLVDDGEERAANGNTKCESKALALDHVRKPKLDCHLVEAEALFEDERVVVCEWDAINQVDPSQHVHEEQRLCNLAGESNGRIASDDGASNAPDDRVEVEVESSERLDLVEDLGDEAELGLCATIRLLLVSLDVGYELRMRT
jgi:hypothetical protein